MKHTHIPLSEGKCMVCHNSHGGKIKGYLKRSVKVLCLSCHKDIADKLAAPGSFIHKPVDEGECLKCHHPHYAKEENLLLSDNLTLCSNCHEKTDKGFIQRHGNIPLKEGNCTSCHESHFSKNKNLLHTILHKPFEDNRCIECHPDSK